MPSPVRTLLVDDQILFREAIRTVLSLDGSIEIVGEANNGHEALGLVASLRPQVVLMDLRMPLMCGTEATRRIRQSHPMTRVLMLTTFDHEDDIFGALRAGASGYVLKNTPSSLLVEAIKTVAAGEIYLQPCVATQVVAEFNRLSLRNTGNDGGDRLLAELSLREIEIVRLLARAMSNKEIAAELAITEGTVKNHMTNVLTKFKVNDRTMVALKARELGLG
jgi:DNA-binding NarL/FixJ family response regulator